MNPKYFRTLILLYVVLTVAGIGAASLPVDYSQALSDAFENEPPPPIADNLWVMIGLVGSLMLVVSVGVYGLYMFKRWGRSLSLYSTIAGLIIFPLFGPSLYSGIESALFEASTLLWGAILAISYYSSLGDKYSPEHATQA